MDLMRKSGWLCSHCSPGAPNKALTGGSAGGRDPRRDQREWEWYWALGPAHKHTPKHKHFAEKHKHKPTTCVWHHSNPQTQAPEPKTHTCTHSSRYIWCKQIRKHPTHPKSCRGDEQPLALPPAMQISHAAKHREPTSGSLAKLTGRSSQNQLGP